MDVHALQDRIARSPGSALVALAALAGTGLLLLALTAYVWVVAGRWQVHAEATTADRDRVAAALTDLQAEHSALQQQATEVQTQLDDATGRVRSLSDEKAQVADEREANAQVAERNADVAQQASTVATALGKCANGMSDLLDVVLASPDYDYAKALRSASSADEDCDRASELQQQFVADLEAQ